MARNIRFHLDENINPAVAIGLNRRGIEVTTTADAGLIGAGDEQHLEFCRREGRVLVTTDRDFLRLHANDQDHCGIVFAHQHQLTIRAAIHGLILIWEILEPNELLGRLEFI